MSARSPEPPGEEFRPFGRVESWPITAEDEELLRKPAAPLVIKVPVVIEESDS